MLASAGRHAVGVGIPGRRDRLGDHGLRLVDGSFHPGLDDGFSGKPIPPLDADVGGEDDGIGSLDVCGTQWFGSGGPLWLDLDVDPHLPASGGEVVGGHVGVGDPGGAGGHCHDVGLVGGVGLRPLRTGNLLLVCLGAGSLRRNCWGLNRWVRCRAGRRHRCGGWRGCVWLDDRLDEVHHGLCVGGLPQLFDELGFHQGTSQLGEQLHVICASTFSRRDHEDEVGRPVGSVEVDCRRQSGEPQGWLAHRCGATVWNGKAAGHPGGALGLPTEGVVGQAVGVGASGRGDDSGDRGDDLGLRRSQIGVQAHQFWGDERNVHRFSDLTGGRG